MPEAYLQLEELLLMKLYTAVVTDLLHKVHKGRLSQSEKYQDR